MVGRENNLFDPHSSEHRLLRSICTENGKEMDCREEIKNTNKAFKLYKDDYKSIFGKKEIPTSITTTECLTNVIPQRKEMWQGFAMKLADGASIEQHIEYFEKKH